MKNGILHVIVISTTHGLKFNEFKIGYHEKSLKEVTVVHANPLVEVAANVDAVRKAIDVGI